MRDLRGIPLSPGREGVLLALRPFQPWGPAVGVCREGTPPQPLPVSLPTCASWLPWNFPLTSPEANLPFAGTVFLSFPVNNHLMRCTVNRESFGSTQWGCLWAPQKPSQMLAGSTQGLRRKGCLPLISPLPFLQGWGLWFFFQGRPTAAFLITKQKDYRKALPPDCCISTEFSAMTPACII